MVTVVLSARAAKDIDALPLAIRARVLAIIQRLARWPEVSGAKPLHGELSGHYRIRTGDYRVQFHLIGDALIVEKVGHRDGFYDQR